MINLYKEKIKNDDEQLNLPKNMNLKIKPYIKCRFICAGRGGDPRIWEKALKCDMTIYVDAYHDKK